MAYETSFVVKAVVVDGLNSPNSAKAKLSQLAALNDHSKAKEVRRYRYKRKIVLRDLLPIGYVLKLDSRFNFKVSGAELIADESGEVSIGIGGRVTLTAEYAFGPEAAEGMEKSILDMGFERIDGE